MGNEKEDDYYIYIFHAFLVFNFIFVNITFTKIAVVKEVDILVLAKNVC